MTRPSLGVLLSFNGGYVDMGFLAFAGLFTAHVTGNFVTLGATLAFGATGVIAKLIALPVFCIVILPDEPLAPFSGVKQSGIGREFSVFGLEAFLEPRSVLA